MAWISARIFFKRRWLRSHRVESFPYHLVKSSGNTHRFLDGQSAFAGNGLDVSAYQCVDVAGRNRKNCTASIAPRYVRLSPGKCNYQLRAAGLVSPLISKASESWRRLLAASWNVCRLVRVLSAWLETNTDFGLKKRTVGCWNCMRQAGGPFQFLPS